ncbi:hypothetical protein [Streptomyces sp. LKA04]|uniref:hypothetical protein n=1 Tax=Streptomyces sp. LKA04 TaxID=3398092 RepID=UPI003A809AD1
MSSYYAAIPPQVYEVTWQSGHVERVIAHQVISGSSRVRVAALGDNSFATSSEDTRLTFHAEVDGQWVLQLSALETDIRTIRNITNGEQTPGGAS